MLLSASSGSLSLSDLFAEAVSSRDADGGLVEIRCRDGELLYVAPAVLAYVMPWIKADLAVLWPECSIVLPGMCKHDLSLFFRCLFEATNGNLDGALELVVEHLRVPLTLVQDEAAGTAASSSDDARTQCLSDVDIASIPDSTIVENFSDQEARLVCLVCYKIFGPSEYSSFRSHVVNHTRSALSKIRLRQVVKRDKCAETFVTKEDLASHVANKHEIKCTTCGNIFSTQAAMKSHQRTHRTRDLTCDSCGKKFQNRKFHAAHVSRRVCDAAKRACDTCGKVFSDAARMRIHVRSHTGERPHKCDVCGRAFAQMRSLKEHALTHAERTFACDLCERAFTQSNHLKYHLAAVHGRGGGLHACNICSKVFPFPFQLNRHEKSHVRRLARHFRGADSASGVKKGEG